MVETKKFKIIELTTRQWTPNYVDEWVDIGTWGSIQRATLMVKIKGSCLAKPTLKILWNDNYADSRTISPDIWGNFSETLNFDITQWVTNGKNKFHMDYIWDSPWYLWIDYLYVEVEVTGEGYIPTQPPQQPTGWDIAWWIFVIILVVVLIAISAWSLPRLAKVAKDIKKAID